MTTAEQIAAALAEHRMTISGCGCNGYRHPQSAPMLPSHEAHVTTALLPLVDDAYARGVADGRAEVEAAVTTEDADLCTCGMAEQERTGHAPEHADWCDLAEDDPSTADTTPEGEQ